MLKPDLDNPLHENETFILEEHRRFGDFEEIRVFNPHRTSWPPPGGLLGVMEGSPVFQDGQKGLAIGSEGLSFASVAPGLGVSCGHGDLELQVSEGSAGSPLLDGSANGSTEGVTEFGSMDPLV